MRNTIRNVTIGRAGVNDQLPRVAKVEFGTEERPAQDDRRCRQEGERATTQDGRLGRMRLNHGPSETPEVPNRWAKNPRWRVHEYHHWPFETLRTLGGIDHDLSLQRSWQGERQLAVHHAMRAAQANVFRAQCQRLGSNLHTSVTIQ
jgi:hypothetical protein